MNLLRAAVRNNETRWEARLLDLAIAADGETEAAMLKDLEHSLTAECYLARKYGRTPFMNIRMAVPTEVAQSWADGGKTLRGLNLSDDVRQALAAALNTPSVSPFTVTYCDAA